MNGSEEMGKKAREAVEAIIASEAPSTADGWEVAARMAYLDGYTAGHRDATDYAIQVVGNK